MGFVVWSNFVPDEGKVMDVDRCCTCDGRAHRHPRPKLRRGSSVTVGNGRQQHDPKGILPGVTLCLLPALGALGRLPQARMTNLLAQIRLLE